MSDSRYRVLRSQEKASRSFRVPNTLSAQEEAERAARFTFAKEEVTKRDVHATRFKVGDTVQTPDGIGKVHEIVPGRGTVSVPFRGKRYARDYAATVIAPTG